MNTTIRSATAEDAAPIAAIYNHYILNTCATFETKPVTAGEMEQRIAETVATPLPWLVAERPGDMIGYAYAARWRRRHAYQFSVESAIYLEANYTGNGVGSQLYAALVDAIRSLSLHTVVGGIALPNESSIRLHERLGFKQVGQFEQVGYKHGHWVDVGYWQLIL